MKDTKLSLMYPQTGFQIVNDHGIGGKCYGFVTFTNPRSAVDAINDMNGRVMLSFYLDFD